MVYAIVGTIAPCVCAAASFLILKYGHKAYALEYGVMLSLLSLLKTRDQVFAAAAGEAVGAHREHESIQPPLYSGNPLTLHFCLATLCVHLSA